MIRIVLFVLVFGGLLAFDGSKLPLQQKKKWYIVFVSVLLILQSGLRHVGVGSDTYQYYLLYEMSKDYDLKELLNAAFHFDTSMLRDPFYFFVCNVFDRVFHSYRLFLFFVAIVFFTSLGKLLYKYLDNVSEIFIAYIFYLGMFYGYYSITMIRQTLAVAIVIIAYDKLVNKRYVVAVLLTLFAALFHASALIFLLVFLLPINTPRGTLVYFTLLLLPLVFIGRYYIANLLIDPDGMYGMYLDWEDGKLGSSIMTILYLLVFAGMVLSRKKLVKMPELNGLINLYTIAIAFLPLLWVNNSAIRISFYFSFSMFVLIPKIVTLANLGITNSLKYAIVTIVMFVLMTFSIKPGDYRFFWQPMNVIGRPTIDPTLVVNSENIFESCEYFA